MSSARLVLAVASAAIVGCGGSAKSTADWIADGHLGVGVHTYTFVDDSRPTPANGSYAGAPNRTLVTEVWYPSTTPGGPTTDAPLLPGKYPLVLHSHGFMDSPGGEDYLGMHLASYGYIVAAPGYPLSQAGAPGGPTVDDTPNQPLDASFVIDQLLAQSADSTSMLAGAVDGDHIVASGLSLGGLTTLLLGFHPTSRDPRLKAALAMAPPSCMFTETYFDNAPALPLVLLHGSVDAIVPPDENSERIFPFTKSPSELILLANGSHTGFATPAMFLSSSESYDAFGCMALGSVNVSSFATLGSMAQGISQDPSVCSAPCQNVPTMPSLDAARQQDLTKAIALAFFQGVLGRDKSGTEFVQSGVKANAEVSLQLK